ncbi:MAG: sulfatase-like hydrolase/transferase [Kiritimatiellaeota bacterium]|nr:sulfatase-like hydrolase/transferase [Kiritimatiellota bacterium]
MRGAPNILFLMTDHTNAAAVAPVGPCLTPNLDRLALRGTRFARCYTPNAICSPARASLMTGVFPSTHGMWDCTHTQRREWVNVDVRLTHWSQILASAGYRNGYFGKWHVEQTKALEAFGWHEYDIGIGGRRRHVIPGSEIIANKAGYKDYLMAATGEDDGTTAPTHPAFDRGIDFLRRCTRESPDRPFCCFVSTAEPHDPYIPPKRFLDLYDRKRIPLSPTLHDKLEGKPEILRRMQAVWQCFTERDWRQIRAAYWALITFLDHEVGRILAVLDELDLTEDTIVVFTSDHGDMLGGHGLATKGVGTAYEEVYNIPLIIAGPRAQARGEDRTTVTSLVDLGPTLLDFCGLDPLPVAQGRSLRPVFDGAAVPSEWQDAYAEFFGQRFVYTQRLVWHGAWKFVFSPGGIDELYNLDEDPHEARNLAADPAYRHVLIDMTRRMWRQMARIGDESLLNTHYATLRTAAVGPYAADFEP